MLVSAILPTKGRSEFAAKALQCFLSQTYANRELIIFDDLNEPSFSNDVQTDGIYYLRHDTQLTIAEKRNFCCGMASGEVVCHFDSDDWSAPERIADQVERLKESRKGLTGYHSAFFYDEDNKKAYWYDRMVTNFVLGTSMCYLKSFWKDHPFRETKYQREDNYFCGEANK